MRLTKEIRITLTKFPMTAKQMLNAEDVLASLLVAMHHSGVLRNVSQLPDMLRELTDHPDDRKLYNMGAFRPGVPRTLAALSVGSHLIFGASRARFQFFRSYGNLIGNNRVHRIDALASQCPSMLVEHLKSENITHTIRLPGTLSVFDARGEPKLCCGRCRRLFRVRLSAAMLEMQTRPQPARPQSFRPTKCCETEICLRCAATGLQVHIQEKEG